MSKEQSTGLCGCMDLRKGKIGETKDYFMMSNWTVGKNVLFLLKRAKLEGRACCAMCYSSVFLDARKTKLSLPVVLCNLGG